MLLLWEDAEACDADDELDEELDVEIEIPSPPPLLLEPNHLKLSLIFKLYIF